MRDSIITAAIALTSTLLLIPSGAPAGLPDVPDWESDDTRSTGGRWST
jgi:hypothetical protein